MLTNAPWLDLRPGLFTEAAAKGAGLGLEASKIATDANEAADRLRQSYASLAAQQAMHAMTAGAENQRAMAQMALAAANQKAENEARWAHIGIAAQHQNLLEQNAADKAKAGNAARLLHIGGGLYAVDPSTGKPSTVIEPPAKADPYIRLKYQSALNRLRASRTALNRARAEGADTSGLQSELNDAMAEVKQIEDQFSKQTGASAAPQAGTADGTAAADSLVPPMFSPLAPYGDLQAPLNFDEQSAPAPRKYKVEPLQ